MKEETPLNNKNLDYLISKIGYGRYQAVVFLVSGFTSFTQGSELVLLSIFQKYLNETSDYNKLYISMLISIIFFGQTIGILISGFLSDKLGRLYMLKCGYVFIIISGIASALYKNDVFFVVFRTITNIGIGLCLPVGITYALENSPSKNRGILAISFEICYMTGQSIALLIVWLFMNTIDGKNWNIVFATTCGLGIGVVILIFLYLKETPWFLLKKGKAVEALSVVQYISLKNTGKILESGPEAFIDIIEPIGKSHISVNIIFGNNYLYRTLTFMFAMATNLIGFCGSFYLFPILLGIDNFYIGYLICITAIFPFWVLCLFLIERSGFGRKNTLGIYFGLITVLSCIGIPISDYDLGLAIIFGCICGIASVCNIILVPFILEQYETEIRSSSYTVINVVARILIIYIPPFFAVISGNRLYPVIFYCGIYFVSTVLIGNLTIDTTGRELDFKHD
jgi:MFS transporter, putative metabolite:H+ symporter